MDAVFSLQRAGADAVFAYQFPFSDVQPQIYWGGIDREKRKKKLEREDFAELREPKQAKDAVSTLELPASSANNQRPEAKPASLAALTQPPTLPGVVAQESIVQIVLPGLNPLMDEDALVASASLYLANK